jgi:hypothetical protein
MTAEELDRIEQRKQEWGGSMRLSYDEIDALIAAARRGLNYDVAWTDGWMARDMEEEEDAPPPVSLVETLRAAAKNQAKHSPVRPRNHTDLLEWKAADAIGGLEKVADLYEAEIEQLEELIARQAKGLGEAHAKIERLKVHELDYTEAHASLVVALTAERDRLRRALQQILEYSRTGYINREIASAALSRTKESE